MSHIGQEVVKNEQERLFGPQVWLQFKSIITTGRQPTLMTVVIEVLPARKANGATHPVFQASKS